MASVDGVVGLPGGTSEQPQAIFKSVHFTRDPFFDHCSPIEDQYWQALSVQQRVEKRRFDSHLTGVLAKWERNWSCFKQTFSKPYPYLHLVDF